MNRAVLLLRKKYDPILENLYNLLLTVNKLRHRISSLESTINTLQANIASSHSEISSLHQQLAAQSLNTHPTPPKPPIPHTEQLMCLIAPQYARMKAPIDLTIP